MDVSMATIVFLTLLTVSLIHFLKPKPPSSNLPPSPTALPILGHILQFGSKPHRSLAKLAQIHGPLMLLKLGFTNSLIVSSSQIAKIVLLKQDQICCARSPPNAVAALGHDVFSVAWMPVDDRWRQIRKLCREKMFSTQRLEKSQGLRMEKLRDLRVYLTRCAAAGEAVDLGKAAFTTSLNLMSASLFSFDIAALGTESSQELRVIIGGIMEIIGKPNLADYFPILKLFDPQGILRKNTAYFKKCFEIFDKVIEERLRMKAESKDSMPKNDMLEELLDFNQNTETPLSSDHIKHLLLDLFVAGADTTSGIVEWAMSELIRSPRKLRKSQDELKSILGQQQIQESDISKLPYLQAIVKETFRLHPTVPFLLPRRTLDDIDINGYTAPKGTQILINVWAIARDSNSWNDPEMFMPERFLETDIDVRGRHFELIPFGSGRRVCLGLPLAHRMVHMMLATLVANFDWKMEHGLGCDDVDMDDRFGLSLQKAIPLRAIPILNL